MLFLAVDAPVVLDEVGLELSFDDFTQRVLLLAVAHQTVQLLRNLKKKNKYDMT